MRKLISFFIFLIISFSLMTPYTLYAKSEENVGIDSYEASYSQILKIPVKILADVHFSGIQLAIDYDKELTLLDVESSAKIKMENSSITGAEEGRFMFVGSSFDESDVYMNMNETLFTLTFRIPEEMQKSTFNVSVDSENSLYIIMSDIGNSIRVTLKASDAQITADKISDLCTEHSFSQEESIREATYVQNGVSYKKCRVCGYTSLEVTDPYTIDAITLDGVAIRYNGNKKTGIGGVFNVDMEKILAVENLGYLVRLGIRLEYKDKNKNDVFVDKLFYERDINGQNNVPEENKKNLEDGKISACIENISSQHRGSIYAYIVITDKETMTSRTEKVPMTFLGSEKISIHNVVEVMDISRYQPSSMEYLRSVLDGGE